ncbi:CGNR zinc finger domain-containing protein [Streptomyces sp. PSKA54]|uniref:CGNR zinc finger domain-containing protein n=1 Tax=Streptomyces himalayensis subsp. aureolus TaxID=2758039 RepID=A0A7W2HKF1_9ACTN|nr:CGNR zinc finger domain-containing protein [Streptomyces himalayensis]MBA4866834.1 CGNR zinc finger domain-containing protein [Streptomyces himalayensis subsp. aureolus]
MTEADPRPFVGEPLALDLLNTLWLEHGRQEDLLGSPTGLRVWLAGHGLADRFSADAASLEAVLAAREALAAAVTAPGSPSAARQVDEILGHGRIRPTLTAEGPGETTEFEDPAWGAAWTAAHDYLRLLATAPDRIRLCDQPDCIRYFLDTSRNGARRWCSMALCGNRAKAARHYARARSTRD